MINIKQLDRLVFKIVRLKDVYRQYLVDKSYEQQVFYCGKEIKKGEKWGSDFSYANFEFIYSGNYNNPYIYAESGGVEHLLMVDGHPFGMIDDLPNGKDPHFRCHKYVSLRNIKQGAKITVEAYASHTFYGTMPFEGKQTFAVSGYRPERVFNGIYVVEINKQVKTFIENLELLTNYFYCLSEDDSRKMQAYRVYQNLFETLTILPEQPPVESELISVNRQIDEFFNSLNTTDKSNLPFVGIIGHSHLDSAWLWPVEETHHKAVRTVANAVTLLNEYPEYKFIMSSPIHLSWIKKEYPKLFEEIKQLVKAGKFEPNGASWVECDCNITDGESIIRQFLRGKRFLKKEFDYEADVFWLPDTFGYSAALPQIMKGCRIPYFATSKLSWNDTNIFPYESFVWRGIDGSKVIVHFNTIQSKADPSFIASRIKNRLNKHLTENVLVSYGYGDGGGGPTCEMVEEALKTQASYPYAKIEHITVSDFMHRLEKEELPTYRGELYLELHRGTLTTNHDVKMLNRKLENALKDAELISVGLNSLQDKKVTDECYDTLLLNQFHDILPGTCINEVYKISVEENKNAIRTLCELNSGSEYFNTLNFERIEVLDCKNGEQSYIDLNGDKRSISTYSFKPYGYGERKYLHNKGFEIEADGTIKTPYYTIKMSEGMIRSLVYNGREIAKEPLNQIALYEDVPCVWDNWDVDADYEHKPCKVKVLSSEVISCGKIELRVRTVYELAGKSILTQDTVFYSFRPLISFESKLEWKDHHKFVKAYFPTNITADTYKSEIQFGYLERPTTRNTSVEQAKYEVCNHKWTDLSEPRFGVALLNECKYGVSVEEGKMGLSLLKSGLRPDIVGEVGVKYFKYAILPHEGAFTAESVTLPAYAFNRVPIKVKQGVVVPVKGLSESNVIVENIKFGEEEGIILRLYESERSLTKCELYLNENYKIYSCDMLEENAVLLGEGTQISLDFKPFEIKTLLLKR